MIRKYVDDRIGLSAQEQWSGGVADRDLILSCADETLEYHEKFSESLYAEMVAMAEAAGTTAPGSSTPRPVSLPRPGTCTPRRANS
jgi:hypothetical protein